jgi:hypothetical protein
MKKIKDIIAEAVDKKISYDDAKKALKSLNLPDEEYEGYDNILQKLLCNFDKLDHRPTYQLKAIPNEMFIVILQDTIKKVREEWYTPEICTYLFNTYRISSQLMNYFVNEAISIVRLNTTNPDEILRIGEAYQKASEQLKLAQTLNPDKQHILKIEFQPPSITNAEPVNDILIIEEGKDE